MNRIKFGVLMCSFFFIFLAATPVFATSGSLNSSGCHTDARVGYHCHNGSNKDSGTPSSNFNPFLRATIRQWESLTEEQQRIIRKRANDEDISLAESMDVYLKEVKEEKQKKKTKLITIVFFSFYGSLALIVFTLDKITDRKRRKNNAKTING